MILNLLQLSLVRPGVTSISVDAMGSPPLISSTAVENSVPVIISSVAVRSFLQRLDVLLFRVDIPQGDDGLNNISASNIDMRFSQRFGFKPVKTSIQKESMDQDLRNSLWSALKIHYWDTFRTQVSYGDTVGKYFNQQLRNLCERLWLDFFKLPLDNLSPDWEVTYARLRDLFFKWSWDEVYDFIEFVAQNYSVDPANKEFMAFCNNILEREMSAYRFVGGAIAPITSEEEISAINDAMTVKISPVRAHLNSALEKLTDRKHPDYRNSIKESISAVEALVQKTTHSDQGTLGQLLKILESKTGLHPSLKGAFDKLYGYTSDADGIRHALLEEDKVTFEQAKFMLVVCSAFTNYVIGTLK